MWFFEKKSKKIQDLLGSAGVVKSFCRYYTQLSLCKISAQKVKIPFENDQTQLPFFKIYHPKNPKKIFSDLIDFLQDDSL